MATSFPECPCLACKKCMINKELWNKEECPNDGNIWFFMKYELPAQLKLTNEKRWESGYTKCKYEKCPKWFERNNYKQIKRHEQNCYFRFGFNYVGPSKGPEPPLISDSESHESEFGVSDDWGLSLAEPIVLEVSSVNKEMQTDFCAYYSDSGIIYIYI